jgi:hypothetical protein
MPEQQWNDTNSAIAVASGTLMRRIDDLQPMEAYMLAAECIDAYEVRLEELEKTHAD